MLIVQREGDVARIILNRPDKRNALTRSMLTEFRQSIEALSADTRLVVLSAAGPAFCAGMDLQEMQATAQQPDSAEIWQRDSDLYRQVVESLFLLPCPTLGVVQGPVLAGGVGLVLACDLVIGSDAASFALPEPKRGITASMVAPLLIHRIGSSAAAWMLLSGQTISAAEARQCGVIHKLVSADTLAEGTAETINSILTGAPGALRVTKQQLLQEVSGPLRAAWDTASQLSAKSRAQPEAREGLQAFLEKRKANWM